MSHRPVEQQDSGSAGQSDGTRSAVGSNSDGKIQAARSSSDALVHDKDDGQHTRLLLPRHATDEHVGLIN
jgi:hypothetical protein